MKRLFFCAIFLALSLNMAAAQDGAMRVPMNADSWDSKNDEVEFIEHKSRQAMKILSGQEMMVARDINFSNGTIEFDVDMQDAGFSLYFRRENERESEVVYFRPFRLGNPTAPDVIQYTTMANGVLMWNVHGHYQSSADHQVGDWNRVKMVVSGKRMLVYIHDMEQPALQIPHLEGNAMEGGIALEGASVFANLVIKPGEVEGLSPEPEYDITLNDPRYLREWEVSEPFLLPYGHEMVSANRNFIASEYLPDEGTSWASITAERLGLINLSRKFGVNEERRAAWLKINIEAEEAQLRSVDFGFLDEVWVILNGQLVYVDKNTYNNPIMKEPRGRLSVENTSFMLPLRPGSNQLLIGLASDFWTWGVIARLDAIDGLTF